MINKVQIKDGDRVHLELGGGAFTTIDLIEFFRHEAFRTNVWFRDPNKSTSYAQSKINRVNRRAHTLIMGPAVEVGFPVVDHINGDGLDNRRENLRFASYETQSRNARKRFGEERNLFTCLRDSFSEDRIWSFIEKLAEPPTGYPVVPIKPTTRVALYRYQIHAGNLCTVHVL